MSTHARTQGHCHSNVGSASLRKGYAKEQDGLYPPEASTSNSLSCFCQMEKERFGDRIDLPSCDLGLFDPSIRDIRVCVCVYVNV